MSKYKRDKKVDVAERIILSAKTGIMKELQAYIDNNGVIHVKVDDEPLNNAHLVTVETEITNGDERITYLTDCDPETGKIYYIEVISPTLLREALMKELS